MSLVTTATLDVRSLTASGLLVACLMTEIERLKGMCHLEHTEFGILCRCTQVEYGFGVVNTIVEFDVHVLYFTR